ncbi:MAG: hypothetical protein HPY83_02085 [Anaerolineae bacterium]|nr:hypothetical protein [Anaerolineae bacterium]
MKGAKVEGDASAFELSPEVDEFLEAMLRRWAEGKQLPRATLEQIRRTVLAYDPAYEPLTQQWWRRVLGDATAALRTTADVREFLKPIWQQA